MTEAPLLDYLNRIDRLMDDLDAAWTCRRAKRPAGQQTYHDRQTREHSARMAIARVGLARLNPSAAGGPAASMSGRG